jgi:hypothetical protein
MRSRLFSVLAIVACVAIASCASSAQLMVSGSAPLFDNSGTCAAPLLAAQPASNPALRIVLSWAGPVAGIDSTYAQPGAAFVFVKQLPSGTYTLTCHATDAGGAGCDTTITKTIKAPPFSVSVH